MPRISEGLCPCRTVPHIHSRGGLESPWAKPPSADIDESVGPYNCRHEVFSPSNIGVPSERFRKYIWLKLHGGGSDRLDATFQDIFYSKLVATPSLYIVGSKSWRRVEDKRRRAETARCKNEDWDSSADEGMPVDTNGDFERLDGWRSLAVKSGLVDGSKWRVDVALANLAQLAEFMKVVNTTAAPAILRKSILFDLVTNSRLLVSELWLLQGFPHPAHVQDMSPEDIDRRIPFYRLLLPPRGLHDDNDDDGTSDFASLTLRQQMSAVGNLMHPAQVGAWVLFNIF